jgi:hypothetical protein
MAYSTGCHDVFRPQRPREGRHIATSSVSVLRRRPDPRTVSDRRCIAPVRGCPIDGAALLPELLGKYDRVVVDFSPPRRLVAPSVQGAVVRPAKRDCELVADPPAKRQRLHEPQAATASVLE